MSAISIVSKTLIEHGEYPKELATALQKKYPHLPSAEDIISDPDLVHFFKKKRSPVKKKAKKAKKKNVSSPKKKKGGGLGKGPYGMLRGFSATWSFRV